MLLCLVTGYFLLITWETSKKFKRPKRIQDMENWFGRWMYYTLNRLLNEWSKCAQLMVHDLGEMRSPRTPHNALHTLTPELQNQLLQTCWSQSHMLEPNPFSIMRTIGYVSLVLLSSSLASIEVGSGTRWTVKKDVPCGDVRNSNWLRAKA